MVADDPSSNRSFGVKTHELAPDSSGQLTCTLSSFALSTHVPLGAAILRREDNEWSLVGILNPANQDPSNPEIFLPVWLSSELFQQLNSGKSTLYSYIVIKCYASVNSFRDYSPQAFAHVSKSRG